MSDLPPNDTVGARRCLDQDDEPPRPNLGFIGAGKVGSVLARLLAAAGYTVVAVYSRTQAHAAELAAQVGAKIVTAPGEVVAAADLTFLAVPDDAIRSIAETVGASLCGRPSCDKAIVHTSGARDIGELSALAECGVMTGSLHPIFPFASIETALAQLPGATFAVEATDESLRGWLKQIVAALHGQMIEIPPDGKMLYHAALVIASNYTVILYAVAQQLLIDLGADKNAAAQALNTLVAATVDNLRRQGIPAALTGPLARADLGTIAAHLDVLQQHDENLANLYRQLARFAYPMLTARGIAIERIEQLLISGGDHAINHP